MLIKISKKEWMKIGHRAGWLTSKKMNQICAWCGDLIAVKQDGSEPLDEQLPDSHGLCSSCKDIFMENLKKERGLTDADIEALQAK